MGHGPFIGGVGLLLLTACGSAVPTPNLTPSSAATAILAEDPPNRGNERISITNDEGSLEDRIGITSGDVPIEPTRPAATKHKI